jgi:hypothetical protein
MLLMGGAARFSPQRIDERGASSRFGRRYVVHRWLRQAEATGRRTRLPLN